MVLIVPLKCTVPQVMLLHSHDLWNGVQHYFGDHKNVTLYIAKIQMQIQVLIIITK